MDYQIKSRQKKLRKIERKQVRRDTKTWWAELGILLVITIIFTVGVGLYLTLEDSYKDVKAGRAITVESYLTFSNRNQ